MKTLLTLTLSFLLFASANAGKEIHYYWVYNGTTQGTGTQSSPYTVSQIQDRWDNGSQNDLELPAYVYFKSGTYYDPKFEIEISGSQSSSEWLIITSAPGETGIIFDGQLTTPNEIFQIQQEYVTLKSIHAIQCTTNVIYITSTHDVKLDKVKVHDFLGRGIKISSSSNVEIVECEVKSKLKFDSEIQTDNIYIYQSDNVTIKRSKLYNLTSDQTYPYNHNDVIQVSSGSTYTADDITVSQSYLENSGVTPNHRGVFMVQGMAGVLLVHNNVLKTSGKTIFNIRNDGPNDNVQFIAYNNTMYSSKHQDFFGFFSLRETGKSGAHTIIKNNIGYTKSVDALAYKLIEDGNGTDWRTNYLTSDYNLYYCYNAGGWGNFTEYWTNDTHNSNMDDETFIDWQNRGRDTHGYESDPDFLNLGVQNFNIENTSDAWENGYTLGSPYDYDALGNPRGTTNWDIGGIESSGDDYVEEENILKGKLRTGELSSGVYPNPFNPSTKITFQIPESGLVSLKIYDVLGNEIATLLNEEKNPGKYEIDFNASAFSSGIYFYTLNSGSFMITKKMILVK